MENECIFLIRRDAGSGDWHPPGGVRSRMVETLSILPKPPPGGANPRSRLCFVCATKQAHMVCLLWQTFCWYAVAVCGRVTLFASACGV